MMTSTMLSQNNANTSLTEKGVIRSNKSIILSVMIGAGMGIMPATSEMVPVFFIVLSLICFWIEPGDIIRKHYREVLPLVIYLCVQLAFIIYHGSIQAKNGFAQGYFQQIIISVLIFRLFYLKSLNKDIMVYSTGVASFSSVLLVFLQYYNYGNGIICRAGAYSGNVQWLAAFQILIGAAVLIYWQKYNLRYSIIAYSLVVAILISIGAFSGARMAFYTFLVFLILYTCYLVVSGKFHLAIKTIGAAVCGVVLTFVVSVPSGCGFADRILDQFRFAPQIIQFFSHSDPNVDNVLGKTPTTEGLAKPVPIILLGIHFLEYQIKHAAQNENSYSVTLKNLHKVQNMPGGSNTVSTDSITDQENANTVVTAGGSRVLMWKNAMAVIRLSPLIGHGQGNEAKFAQAGYSYFAEFTHVHNQFLSWMIWSGIFGLASGIYFIASIILRPADRSMGWAFFGMLSMIFISETLLLPFNMHVIIVIYCFYLRLSRLSP